MLEILNPFQNENRENRYCLTLRVMSIRPPKDEHSCSVSRPKRNVEIGFVPRNISSVDRVLAFGPRIAFVNTIGRIMCDVLRASKLANILANRWPPGGVDR